MIGGYIMNDGSCMMLPNKDGTMIRVPQEHRKPISFKKKETEMMQNYVDVGIGNYVVFNTEQLNSPKKNEENYFQGFWKMSFDGACSKSGIGVGIVFKSPQSCIYPHAIILEFPCTNNEAEYEALIQGLTLALQMQVKYLVVTGDSELVINHIKRRYRIKKERLKHYARRVWEIIDSFNSFNISFVPREKNQKVDSLAVVASLFNTDDSQNHNTFHVKTIFRPSIPDNQEYWQVFENDEHIAKFLTDHDSTLSDVSEEIQSNQKEIHDQSIVVLPKNYVSLESLFTRDDQTKTMDPIEESSIRKVQETQKSTSVHLIPQNT
jgi:ribonuclease HI